MATFDGTTGTLNADGSTEVFTGRGVLDQCVFQGYFGGGVVNTEISADNGITWVETGDRFNVEVAFKIDPFKAKYRFTISASASPSVTYFISSVGV